MDVEQALTNLVVADFSPSLSYTAHALVENVSVFGGI